MSEPCTLIPGDCLDGLRTLPGASVQCCVTSPPYYGLRDYGIDGQIGLEATPDAYVGRMVEVFREVRRVLRDDGTCWLNLGDSYAGNTGKANTNAGLVGLRGPSDKPGRCYLDENRTQRKAVAGVHSKQLLGIPWRVAFALQADGWYLRQDIIWAKPNPMPESVRDRCTKAHEYVFLMSKSPRYYFDAEAIKEPAATNGAPQTFARPCRMARAFGSPSGSELHGDRTHSAVNRNRRSVWTVATRPFKEAHFATMPPALVEPCVLAGCPVGGTVLDPFSGAGTTGVVALRHGRQYVGIELNPAYLEMSRRRIEAELSKSTLLEAAGA